MTDLRSALGLWVATAVVVMVAAAAFVVPASLVETGARLQGVRALAVFSLAGTTTAFTVAAASLVVSRAASDLVRVRRAEVGRWLVVGVLPAAIPRIVGAQLALVSTGASIVGAALGAVVAPPLIAWALATASGLSGVRPTIGPWAIGAAAALTVVIATGAGLRAARAVASSPPLQLLSETTPSRARRRWPRVVGVLVILAVVAQMVITLPSAVDAGAQQLLLIGPLTVVCVALGGIPILRAVVSVTAAILPRWSVTTFELSRDALMRASERLGAASPFVVAIGLPVAFLDGVALSASLAGDGVGPSAGWPSATLILAGPVALAMAAGFAAVHARRPSREADLVVLTALGASPRMRLAVVVAESMTIVLAAAVIAALATLTAHAAALISLGAVAHPPTTLDATPWLVLTGIACAVALLASPHERTSPWRH
ncbi:hypothetical protein N1031_06050 [Herbiconiux moechotypicola]|uniref:FtsX-like permease family protein n=1 Tax=Herbiconiux moechotypicola TaxID=637393 RepID=A0ABN3DEU5_9MICO|nr:hypothetical protein [Herbiconiux moechotypicola]MCS5729318.1 hypothetical protein [Herbiconiux moechotypicola]